MATMQDLIEQWKKEAVQSQTVTSPQIPNIAMYQAQNDVHRDYGADNSAIAREIANQQMLSQPVVQTAPTGLDVTMQEKQDLVNARRAAQALQSVPLGGIGSSLQMLPSMADYQSNAVSNRDGVLKYIADHPDEAEYVTKFLEQNNGEMDGIKYKNFLKQQKDYELAQKWVDPNYKMSKEEEKYGEKLALDRYKVLSSKKNRTPEEDAELRTMDDLFMKTDEFSSFILNSADEAVKAVRGVKWLTDHGFMGPVQMLANKITDPISNKLLGAYDEVDKTPIQNAQVQNPIASGAGRFATNAALYAATNPAFDAIAEASGLTGAGKFALNQAAQFGQDVALDTIPTYVDMTKDGSLSDEEKKELAKGALYNAGGNLVMGGLGELLKGANPAEIPEVDKTVKEATEQAETAQKRVQELARQNEEVLPALGDMTKGADVTPYNVTKAEPEIPKIDTSKPEIAENAQKSASKNNWGRIDLPEDVTEKGASDFDEIYTSIESMRKAAEASGNPKVIEKYEKLAKAVNDYEDTFFKVESEEELVKAKKAADAARQSFIREMKKVDPNYTGELTGTKLGNAAYRRTSMKAAEEANQELADSITEADNMLNTNRWAKDAVPETKSPYKAKEDLVMAEDIGLNPKTTEEPRFKVEEISEAEAPKGETLSTSTEVKERGQSKHIRNADTPMKMEGVSDEVVADFEDNPDLYTVLKNADTKAKAEKIYNTSDNPEVQFRDMLRAKDPAALPLGHQLAKDYSAAGNHEAAAQIYREMGEELTKAGQFSQAAVINMMKNDPLTALEYARRQIDQLNKAGADKFGKKWKPFSLNDAEIDAFSKIKPGDSDAIAKVFDDIGVRIGKEYPTTLLEKGLELRRIAMLFNSRTMLRNTAANVPTRYMRKFSDRLEAVGQNIVHLIDPEFKVTQSLTGGGKEGRKVATEVWNSPRVQNMLKDSPGKYELPSLKNSMLNNKQMFKGTPVDRFLDKYSGDAFNKIAKILGKDVEIDGGIKALNSKLFGKKDVDSVIETIRNATYKALDMGDSPFVKGNFIDRLSSYIKAQGYKSADEVPEEAIQTAWEEAMKATYKDDSWAVHVTQGVKNAIGHVPGVGKPFADALIPFVQAPSNIAARMVDYSPIRGTKGVADIIMGASKSNPKQITRGIEELSKGITGTAATYLGYKLYQAGLLTGAYSDDKDQKAFQKQNGFREFALRYGPNKYYTINWMQPAFQSLMSGVIIADAINNSDQYDSMILDALGYKGTTAGKALGVGKQIAKGTFNSWFDQSTMQSIQELFSGNYSNGTDIAGNIANIGVNDFVGSFVPSSVNAVAKTADTTQRNTYDKSNIINNFVNQQKAKIPGLSQELPAKYDTWGEEMKYADNNLEAAFNRFINPGEGTTDTSDDIDKEITRLFEEAKDSEGKLIKDAGVFPQVAPYKVGDKELNNEEVSQYQEDMGKRSRTLIESFMKSDAYKNMKDVDRIEVVKKLYSVSEKLTEKTLFNKEISDSSEYKKPIAAYEEAGGGEKGAQAVLDYYAGKRILADSGLSASSNAAKEVAAAAAEGNLEEAQKIADNAAKTKEILDKYGLKSNSNAGKAVKEAVDAGDITQAENIAKNGLKTSNKTTSTTTTTNAPATDYKSAIQKYEVKDSKHAQAAYDEYGEAGVKAYQKIGRYGMERYNNAKTEGGSVPSLETFTTTYSRMDSFGTGEKKGDGTVNQDEFLAYVASKDLTEKQVQEYAQLYGDWKTIPVLQKDGTYKFKKKK